MNQKSMLQLLAPFVISAIIFLVFWIIAFILGITSGLLSSRDIEKIAMAFEINIFRMEPMTVVYWIVNVILIFFVETQISEE